MKNAHKIYINSINILFYAVKTPFPLFLMTNDYRDYENASQAPVSMIDAENSQIKH